MEARSCNYCCSGKPINVTCSECVFVVLLSSMHWACATLLFVACPTLQHSSTLSHKRIDFLEKKVIEHKMCVFIFSTTFVWNIYFSRKKWARYNKKYILFFMYSTRYSCPTLMKLEFLDRFSKILKYQISWKSVQWEPSCSMRTDGQTWQR